MHIKHLKLRFFKNFTEAKFSFSNKINAFVGDNGVGKTNLLDALHYLSITKSYLNYKDQQNIHFNSDFFFLEGVYEKNQEEDVVQIQLKKNEKKVLKRNAKAYKKMAEHIGLFPLVMISPYDQNLIAEGSDKRRRFLDNVIGQSNKEYLQWLMHYNKLLAQRNALLKYFAKNQSFSQDNLLIYDLQLEPLSKKIHQTRMQFVQEFNKEFQTYYHQISKKNEKVSLVYDSQLNSNEFADLIRQSLSKDRLLQHTTAGIQKDDLLFLIESHPIKKFGSQGQQKSYLIALKLAKLAYIKKRLNTTPILLLDDIFDKLDAKRVAQLVSLVNSEQFGQIFISDTHQDRTENVLKNINQNSRVFSLE